MEETKANKKKKLNCFIVKSLACRHFLIPNFAFLPVEQITLEKWHNDLYKKLHILTKQLETFALEYGITLKATETHCVGGNPCIYLDFGYNDKFTVYFTTNQFNYFTITRIK